MFDRDAFAGEWALSREITDRHAGQSGHMVGRVVMTPKGADLLAYSESGQMQLADGPVLQATRRYVWRFDGGRVIVTFAEGGDFHSFVPSGQGVGTDHPCGADYYRVAYDFTAWPAWSATWTVTGPRKDYTSVSHYTR